MQHGISSLLMLYGQYIPAALRLKRAGFVSAAPPSNFTAGDVFTLGRRGIIYNLKPALNGRKTKTGRDRFYVNGAIHEKPGRRPGAKSGGGRSPVSPHLRLRQAKL
ncbi:hypothetical protein SDC9_188192 [bioreactor metagenome]|uniref:Uncharacterized protein n=1 Tax=bioreactor metagenome TaxID=1076179 RepID=A0A645HWT6_9ZZZZ